jgi:hypothetical protein
MKHLSEHEHIFELLEMMFEKLSRIEAKLDRYDQRLTKHEQTKHVFTSLGKKRNLVLAETRVEGRYE